MLKKEVEQLKRDIEKLKTKQTVKSRLGPAFFMHKYGTDANYILINEKYI